jgi:hypothetical protein
MKNFFRWLAGIFRMAEPSSPIVESVNQARDRFMQAYSDQNYAVLCDHFHESAKFRGSVYPERWSFTRDQIITDRYMSSETCTAIRGGATAVPLVGTKSVGSMSLLLRSERVTPFGMNYAVDIGVFDMVVHPGHDATPTAGPYFMLWRKDGDAWSVIHMDMQP